jgi:hypothetical protein
MKTIKIISIIVGFILFFIISIMLFEPNTDPTGLFTYVPALAVINNNNNVPLNNNLEIVFITSSKNDLTITSLTGEMEFVELRCNDQTLNPVVDKDKIIYKDYNCRGNSVLLVKVLSKELNLEFKFGKKIQQAQNTAP